jgi:hypothetical protein
MLGLSLTNPAFAQSAANKVYGTGIDQGEFELEARGGLDFDDDPDKDGKHKHKLAAGYGVTGFWFTELIAELEQEGEEGANFIYEATEWENRFELLEETESLPGVGLYTALVIAEKDGKADKVEWRALMQKRLGALRHRLNINFDKEFGPNRNTRVGLGYGWQTKWYVLDDLASGFEVQPGFEAFGDFGEIGDFRSGADQKHQVGPALFTEYKLSDRSKFELKLASMFGVTRASPDVTLKWEVEYVIKF